MVDRSLVKRLRKRPIGVIWYMENLHWRQEVSSLADRIEEALTPTHAKCNADTMCMKPVGKTKLSQLSITMSKYQTGAHAEKVTDVKILP